MRPGIHFECDARKTGVQKMACLSMSYVTLRISHRVRPGAPIRMNTLNDLNGDGVIN
jgi:hypothetical protein